MGNTGLKSQPWPLFVFHTEIKLSVELCGFLSYNLSTEITIVIFYLLKDTGIAFRSIISRHGTIVRYIEPMTKTKTNYI